MARTVFAPSPVLIRLTPTHLPTLTAALVRDVLAPEGLAWLAAGTTMATEGEFRAYYRATMDYLSRRQLAWLGRSLPVLEEGPFEYVRHHAGSEAGADLTKAQTTLLALAPWSVVRSPDAPLHPRGADAIRRALAKAATLWKAATKKLVIALGTEAVPYDAPQRLREQHGRFALTWVAPDLGAARASPRLRGRMDVLRGALDLLVRRVARILPGALRVPLPLEVYLEGPCGTSGTAVAFYGAHKDRQRVLGVCLNESFYDAHGVRPNEVVMVLAHELGHHLWQTQVPRSQHGAWTRVVGLTDVLTEAERVRFRAHVEALGDRWPGLPPPGETARRWLQFSAVRARAGYRSDDSPLAVAWDVSALEGAHVEVPRYPVTLYGTTNPEEAFCDALGLVVAYGPRAVLPEILASLEALLTGLHPQGAYRHGVPSRPVTRRVNR